jgi:hypothetical protein
VVAVVDLLAGFLSRNLLLPSIMASLVSLFTAVIVYLPGLRFIDRKSASEESKESASELLTEARLSETPAQQPWWSRRESGLDFLPPAVTSPSGSTR